MNLKANLESREESELGELGRKFAETLHDNGALFGAETMERLCHEIAANAKAVEGAFDALDQRRGMPADFIE